MKSVSYLAKYKKEDFIRMSWSDYGQVLEKLYHKVSNYLKEKNLTIDAIIPILRGGAFPATYLAFKLNQLRILPVQYKYFFEGKKIVLRQILFLSKTKLKLPRKPVFLLVENNHCFGLTAETAARDLKKDYPNCKIIYATDHVDYSYQKSKYTNVIFYGRLTNETRALSEKECQEKRIENISYLFPWEDINEEWITVKGKQFPYKDLKTTLETSNIKVVVSN